ncbi:YheV family putative zinc ribbon protein [Moellerella wisconsensis]|uniref:Putative cytoplasmic protein n=3 Tax=Moellerella wisconsensis TaxID=158849 RepID=A0A0N0Z926_9GAMM|nr:YheV family putative zinc ribbon protein [Moellerella wisconsensis]KLN97541.1 hypothetical protein VK86_04070 [Moellerella wisconsensis]KPD03895.1 putative cytoplasmic protein [Moellerella wisconsensis ATCC 35017]UNH24411.1 YheV family putative metal-binding protein [Moellerella wisconsensis]UNH27515.1 YheV family putative metal-binding protein [Moellerella wisconsensis]UNH30989.1 YheV family putative metal-binding protein [Moellerella wisconsensis]
MPTIRKRFIAGAVCPQCKLQDTLMMWRENKVDVVECVECGHQQRQADEAQSGKIKKSEQIIGLFTPE